MVLKAYTAAVMSMMAAAHPDVGGTVTDAAQARRIHAEARFPPGPPVGSVEDVDLDGGLSVRVYRPRDPGAGGALPVVVYFHGGGFVLCDLDTHDGVCRMIAERTPAVVIAVHYRRAPEHPFPAAVEDAYRAVRWAAENAAAYGAAPDRLAVAGDSAGGTLATVACLMARDQGGPSIRFQLLVYPVTDCFAPRTEHARGFHLTRRQMTWFIEQYLADSADGGQPYASPLRAPDLSGLPPALVLTVEHDPLRAEGEAYARRLADAAVPATLHRVDGLFHGVFGLSGLLPEAGELERLAVAALRDNTRSTTTRRG
ncbi:alpha/beta hydrolase fold domain-containing protein [Amycolatopsis sp. NPDC049868]|uniref:alpha/beta hydrolase n=1 Tax=Amycolatopsis sp. NPDC049868 TaxID=3363934 RepID=UPI00379EBFE1